MISTKTLVKIASIGGITIGGLGYGFRYIIRSDIRKSEYYQEAIKSVRNHAESRRILGEPIEEKSIILDGDGFGSKGIYRWFTITLKGSNTSAWLRYWIEAEEEEKKFRVCKIEVKFDNIPGKVYVLKDDSVNIPST